jgi:ankyrin repeat protein
VLTVAYDRSAHLRLLQSQADAARLKAGAERLGGDSSELDGLTPQQLVDLASRGAGGTRLQALLSAANHEREAMRELSEMKEGIMQRIEQIAREDRGVTKTQSTLVEERRELIAHADQITVMRRHAEAAEAVARTTMDTARTTALKLTNKQFAELRSMRKPARSVLVIVEALSLLLEDVSSRKKQQAAGAWEWKNQGRLSLKNPRKLKSRLKSLDTSSLGAKRVDTLRKMLTTHDVTLRTVPRLSSVCQALAKFLLAVCESWQAARDLLVSQQEQVAANKRYDANTQMLVGLEAKVDSNREQMAALQSEHDQQMSLQHQIERETADARDKLEKAEGVLREANFVKPICDAVRHRHHKQLRALLDQDRFSSAAGFYRGCTPLHVAAEHDNALAAAELLQQAGVQLMLQSWYDPGSVFAWLLQRKSAHKRHSLIQHHGPDELEDNDDDDATLDDPDADHVPLAMIAQLAVDVAAPSSSVLELELIQPRLYDLIASSAPFEDTGVSKTWFEAWWLKARPIRSPLWIAASHGYHETVQAMLTECDTQATIGRGMAWGPDIARAWHTAVWRGHIDVVRCFGTLHSLNFRQMYDANHYTALWNAIRLQNNPLVQCLCEVKCDLSDGGHAAVGESPLHLAVRLGDAAIVQTLVDSGADMLATDASGGTPCHTACRAGHDYLVDLLYDVTDADGEPAEVRDRLGRTALDIALGRKHLTCCGEIVRIRHNRRLHSEWMSRSEKAVASLPRAKSECTMAHGQLIVGGNGWSLLHVATQMGLVETVKLALEKCADQEVALKAKARDFSMTCSWTPLMLAVLGQGRDPEILRLLISAGEASWCGSGLPPVRERNEENWDALWLASNEGHTELVGMLLQAGADPFLCDMQGVNCLMAAALAGQVATSQLLMDTMFGDDRTAGHHMLTTLSTVLFCGLMASDTQLIATALALGVDPNKLDAFGQTVAEHAVAMNCSDDVLRMLARQGHARLWDPPRTPGLPIVTYIDDQLDGLHVADARHEQLREFLDTCEASMQQMSEGEPAWIVAIANSVRAREVVANEEHREREMHALRSPSLRANYTLTAEGKGTVGIALQDGKYVNETERLKLREVVAQVMTARNDLLRNAETEVQAMLSGKRAYKMSLHFYVVTDVLGAAHAFFKRPILLKQVCSQIDPLQRTPLHVAAQLGKTDWVRVLIETTGLSKSERKRMVEAADIHGRTAMHMAVESGSTEMISLILMARPRLLEVEAKSGQTPHELATSLRQVAQTTLAKSRYVECWSRRLVATVDDEALLAMEAELEVRREMERYLQRFGAAGRWMRAAIRAARWCAMIVALPWIAIHTTAAIIVLTMCSPTLREAAVVVHNLVGYTRFAVGTCVLVSLFGGAIAFLAFGGMSEREITQIYLLGCIGLALLFQMIVTCRTLAEWRWRFREPPPRTTVALFHDGFDARSAIWLVLLLLELPQQAALAFIGAEGGWVWKVSLMSPEMFSCVDHTNCEADLRNMTEHGIAVREACDNEFCATCNLAGQCDSACGYCAATIVGLQPFELVATLASVAAVAWIFVVSVTGLSFGLARARPSVRSKLPPIRADIWRLRWHDLWMHFFCHTIYLPVVATFLRVADCRAPSSSDTGSDGSTRTWLFSDWRMAHQWHSTGMECWSGSHAHWVVPSAMLLLVYQLLTGALPAILHQPVPYGRVTVATPHTFDSVSRCVKMLMVLCATFSGASTGGLQAHLVATCSAFGGNLALALVVVLWPPSEHRTMRRLRLSMYCTAACVAATALLSVLVCSQERPAAEGGGMEGEGRRASLTASAVSVDYQGCHASNIALVIGLLIASAASYHALESVTGLPPFSRVALGARRRNAAAVRRIIPVSSPALQATKHGTWLGRLIGSLDASAAAAAAGAAASPTNRRSLAAYEA